MLQTLIRRPSIYFKGAVLLCSLLQLVTSYLVRPSKRIEINLVPRFLSLDNGLC